MKRVYLADADTNARSALRLLLIHLDLQIVGEASDWPSVLALAPACRPEMVLVDWGLVSSRSGTALMELRRACPDELVIVLLSHLNDREQAALSAGADEFISKGETAERVVERLLAAAARG